MIFSIAYNLSINEYLPLKFEKDHQSSKVYYFYLLYVIVFFLRLSSVPQENSIAYFFNKTTTD